MDDLWLAITLLCLLFLFGSLIALPFKKLRPKAKWSAPASAIAAIVCFVLFGMATTGRREEDRQAVAKGFANATELHSAELSGINDPVAWRAAKTELRLKTEKAMDANRRAMPEDKVAASTTASEIKRGNDVQKPISKSDALNNFRIDALSWRKSGFGLVMVATFMIHNDNDFAVKDVAITCKHAANSGTGIDSNTRSIHESVGARGYYSVENMNMGFISSDASSSICRVVNFSKN